MKPVRWITDLPSRLRREGIEDGLRGASQDVTIHLLRGLDSIDRRDGRIYDEEWDVLVVLDACRVDALRAVAGEYPFVAPEEIGVFRSAASCSRRWMARNFNAEYREEMARTVHVTANPFSDSHLDASDFLALDEVWTYAWDDERGTVPARSVTDRAITVARDRAPERLVVHYMQPHFPSVPEPLGGGIDIETFGRGWNSIWDRLEDGEIDAEAVRRSYVANLRYVLDDIGLLLESVDADRVVISADHGNAFGEWGYYGHPPGIPIGVLREVPWVVTSARDTSGYAPSTEAVGQEVDGEAIEDRLKHLGYL
jgi:hypothetical protein